VTNFKIINSRLTFSTKGEIDFIDLTCEIQKAGNKSGIQNGFAHIFAPHATGVLLLTENDPALLKDIKAFLESLAPKNKEYNHPINSYAHLRSILFQPDRSLPIIDSQVELGEWQSLLFVETDVYPRKRTIIIQLISES
jgi:secondary thiamine-phosphate synthase enzyme